MTVTITMEGLEKILSRLDMLPTFRSGVTSGALYVKERIAIYPPRRHGKQPPKTAKQRAFLIWAIRTGRIEVPYRRGQSSGSQTLGRRWTVRFDDQGKQGIIGNNVSYGPYVQGDQQSLFHKTTGWKTTRQVARDEGPAVRKYVQDAIRNHLTR